MVDKKISFYVGIIPKDESKFKEFVHVMNEDSDENYSAFIQSEFNDPEGYYNYQIIGSWKAYECFLAETSIPGSFVKSLVHYEE